MEQSITQDMTYRPSIMIMRTNPALGAPIGSTTRVFPVSAFLRKRLDGSSGGTCLSPQTAQPSSTFSESGRAGTFSARSSPSVRGGGSGLLTDFSSPTAFQRAGGIFPRSLRKRGSGYRLDRERFRSRKFFRAKVGAKARFPFRRGETGTSGKSCPYADGLGFFRALTKKYSNVFRHKKADIRERIRSRMSAFLGCYA